MNQERIITAALKVAEKYGYERMTRQQVASQAECAPALVSYYCGDMDQLRDSVVAAAMAQRCYPVIIQAMSAKHDYVLALPESDRRQAAKLMMSGG